MYYRDQKGKLVMQSQKEREDKLSVKKQTRLSAFLNLKSKLIDMTKTNMVTILDGDNRNDNTLAKTAIDLTKNIGIHDNIKRCLEL